MKSRISRRTMLKGVGTAIALPWFESLGLAAPAAAPTIANGVPQRIAFLYVPNGVNMAGWSYSCAYNSTVSWRGDATPNAMEVNPKLAFERLFSGADPKELKEARDKRALYNKSVLDFVTEDAKGLNKTLGQTDQKKLDEFLTSVREVEQRIEKIRQSASAPIPKPNMTVPTDVIWKDHYQDHIRIM